MEPLEQIVAMPRIGDKALKFNAASLQGEVNFYVNKQGRMGNSF